MLYERLHRGEVIRATNLSAELGVNRRTLERDLALLHELRDSRLEKVTEPEPGWRLVGEGRQWKTTMWQVLAVALGARMSGFLSGRRFDVQVRPLLQELRASLPRGRHFDLHDLEKKLHVIESGQKLYRDKPESQRSLEQMINALLSDQPTTLTYHSPPKHDKSGTKTSFRVHALCMTVHRGAVYFVVDVLGGERLVGKRILLALDRMTAVAVDLKSDAMRMPADFNASEYFQTAFGIWTGDEKQHRVRVRIDRSYSAAVQERTWHATQVITLQPDGSLLLEMELGQLHEVADWILGMAQYAKVEAPPELIKLVTDRQRSALAQYGRRSAAT